MNKANKIIGLITAVMCVASQSFAAPLGKITGGVQDSPEENVFRVLGSDAEFILLDTQDDAESKFLIMAKSYFSKRSYGKNQKFDPEDPGNIAYFLNNEFLTEGIKDSFTNRVYKLPDGIAEHIDFTHNWVTEAGRPAGNCPTEYTVTAGVVLLSQEEYLKYQDKIGMTDELDNLIDSPKYVGWWTRTGANTSEMISVRPVTGTTQTYGWAISDASLNIRPAFWVDKDFFKDVAIDISLAGENVKAEFKKYYTVDELNEIYPKQWIYDYLGYTPDVNIKNALVKSNGQKITKLSEGMTNISINADFINNLSEDISGSIVAVKYASGGFPRQMVSIPVGLSAKSTQNAELTFNFKTPVSEGEYVKLFYSSVYDKFANTSNSIIISR